MADPIESGESAPPPTNNFHATVRDAGGGVVDLLVDRETMEYPPIGVGVTVVLDDPRWNLEGGAMMALTRAYAEIERLQRRLFIQVGWFVPSEDPADIRDYLVGLDHPSGLLPNAEPVYRIKEPEAPLSGSSGGAS